jgi:probable F420-dependent oxidoreductase
VDFGLEIAQGGLTWDEIAARARFAEELGFTGVWVSDQFRAPTTSSPDAFLEGWTLLAALASVTQRIRLGTLVSGVTHRSPALLTTQAVTVDHISKGRLELGMGAGWFEQEHRELAMDFPGARERSVRLEEALQVMRLLMTMDNITFLGRYYRLNGASYHPRPVQIPHPPIWIGGSGERLTLPVVARTADVWHGTGPLQELVRKSRLIDEHASKVARDPADIRRATRIALSGPRLQIEANMRALGRAGFSYLTIEWPPEGPRRVESFALDVLPEFENA